MASTLLISAVTSGKKHPNSYARSRVAIIKYRLHQGLHQALLDYPLTDLLP